MAKFKHIPVLPEKYERFCQLKPNNMTMDQFMDILMDSYKERKLKHKLKAKTTKAKLKEIMDLIETSKRLGLDAILIVGEKEKVYEIKL